MKTVTAALLLCILTGAGKPQNPETQPRSVSSLLGKLAKTDTSTLAAQRETERKMSNHPQLPPEVSHSGYHRFSRSLWSLLDPALNARTSQGDHGILEIIRMAMMTGVTPENKWEFYYTILQALASSQFGEASPERQQQLLQLLFNLFQTAEGSGPFFGLVEELLTPLGVNWKVLLRSVQDEACYVASVMNGRSLTDYVRVFLALRMKSNRSIMGTDGFNIQNLLLSLIGKVNRVLSYGLKPIWYFFGQNVFPLFESYIGRVSKQTILKITDFVLEQMLLANNIVKLDEKGQCSQGNLNQLLIWGLLHNLTWSFEAVTIETTHNFSETSPTEFDRTAEAFQIIADSSQFPTRCNQQAFLLLNTTFCNKDSQQQFNLVWLPVFCNIVGGLAGNGTGPLVDHICSKMNFMHIYLAEGLNRYVNYCGKRSPKVEAFSPSGDTRQIEDLTCKYDTWFAAGLYNSTDFGYCAITDEVGFRKTFCTNTSLLETILKNPAHFWLTIFCTSNTNTMYTPTLTTEVVSDSFTISSASVEPPANGVDIYCRYEEWADFSSIDDGVITFCADHDRDRFTSVICNNPSALEQFVKGNFWLAGFCNDYSILNGNGQFCMYSRWKEDPVDPSIVSLCWSSDITNFNKSVCKDGILLNKLQQDPGNAWLPSACNTQNRCRYEKWLGVLSINSDTVVFCKEADQAAFNRTVCTKVSLLQRLLNGPENSWLNDFCVDNSDSAVASTIIPEESTDSMPLPSSANPTIQENVMTAVGNHCRYETWTSPATVDGTVVAMCFNIDSQQFDISICQNPAILEELLKNEFNLWLIDNCDSPSTLDNNDADVATFCQYAQWADGSVDPYLVDFCWRNDQVDFMQFVCHTESLVSELLLYPENAWLKSRCMIQDNSHANDQNQTCLYEEWIASSSIDLAAAKFCSQYDLDNFVQAACDNSTRLWGLLISKNRTWLSGYCSSIEAEGLNPATMCIYNLWTEQRVDSTTVALCFDYDQSNFNKYVCQDPVVLHALSTDPENTWVEADCMSISISTNSAEVNKICPMQELISKLQWTCSLGASDVCLHEEFQLGDIPPLIICGLENIGLMLHNTVMEDLTMALTEAMNKIVMVLLTLEDDQISSLPVVGNVKRSVLHTIVNYLQYESSYNIRKELLQCFGSVLLDLAQKEGGSSGLDLVKEYLKLSAVDLRGLLFAIDIETAKQLLQLVNTNWNGLQIRDDLKRVMASGFFNRIPLIDPNMFPEFVHFLPLLSASEIRVLPATLNKEQVLSMVNLSFGKLSNDQKAAFARWAVDSGGYSNVAAWPLVFLHRIGSLLVYLPFEKFQLLSRLQMLNSLDVLLANNLTALQERFVIHIILTERKAMAASDFERLGRMICSAVTQDLIPYRQNLQVFDIIKKQLLNCIGEQIFVSNELLTEFLVGKTSVINQEAVTKELSSMAGLLPILGISFIKQLKPVQIQALLPELSAMSFSLAQAREVVDKILQDVSITEELLSSLGSVVTGFSPSILQVIPTALLVHALPSMAKYELKLSPVQKLIIVNKLWDSDNMKWIKGLDSLIKYIPLISLRSKVNMLLSDANDTAQMKWSVQQAQMLFGKILEVNDYNMTDDLFSSLGFVAHGVDCPTLKHLVRPSTLLKHLRFFQDMPNELPLPLKNCILEAMNRFTFSMETMQSMKPQLLFDLQLLKIRRFSIIMTQKLLQILVENPVPFLKIPSSKQSLMVDWIVQVLDLYDRTLSEAEFDFLGPALAFVSDEIFMAISRPVMKANLLKIKDYCFDSQKKFLLGDMLTKDTMFGVTTNWTALILDKVDRLVFFLSIDDIQKLPKDVLILERIEMLFNSQKQWEESEFGSTCQQKMESSDLDDLFRKQKILLQTSAGLLNARRLKSKNDPVLSCSAIRNTFPSAWTIDLLTGMSNDDFISCLEMFGEDPHFQPFELFQLLERVKQIYRPVTAMPPKVIEQLGRIATQFTEKDLRKLQLLDLGAVAALGKIAEWNRRELTILFASFLRANRLTVDQLDSVSLVALGHLICGIKPADISAIDPMQFSMAVLWIGRLILSCEEQQLEALAKLVTHSRTFGEVSQWRAEEFAEIGSVAAGLPDIVLSALVKEQIEGLTAVAIATIPPKKFSVVFSPTQIHMFNYQQAVAVTPAQLKELGDIQKKALDLVLTSWHKTAIDIRGRSSGGVISGSFIGIFLCVVCNLSHSRGEAYL